MFKLIFFLLIIGMFPLTTFAQPDPYTNKTPYVVKFIYNGDTLPSDSFHLHQKKGKNFFIVDDKKIDLIHLFGDTLLYDTWRNTFRITAQMYYYETVTTSHFIPIPLLTGYKIGKYYIVLTLPKLETPPFLWDPIFLYIRLNTDKEIIISPHVITEKVTEFTSPVLSGLNVWINGKKHKCFLKSGHVDL